MVISVQDFVLVLLTFLGVVGLKEHAASGKDFPSSVMNGFMAFVDDVKKIVKKKKDNTVVETSQEEDEKNDKSSSAEEGNK